MNKELFEVLKFIFALTIPYLKDLIASTVVPRIKRIAYEKVDTRADDLIRDLAQNASKAASEENEIKKLAYVEGTKLGLATVRALADKLNKAADEIEKVL